MDKSAFIQEEVREISDTYIWEEIKEDLTGKVIHRVNPHLHNILEKGQITEYTLKYLITDIFRTQLFYMYPKFIKEWIIPL